MFSALFILAFSILVALGSPVPSRSCGVTSYGPFRLYAATGGSSDSQLVRLVKTGVDSNKNTISTMTTCESCGDAPAYWTLNDSVLTPVFFAVDDDVTTVNMPLTQGKVNFVTGPSDTLVKSASYCAVRSSSTGGGLPGYLAVNGDAENFSVCSFIGTPGPAHRRDIYYAQGSTPIANHCQPVHLIMQSIGIIPEPIPA